MKNTTENVQRYRVMGSLCRQRAVFDPQNSWEHLGDAARWEHLAHAEIACDFRERPGASSGRSKPGVAAGNTLRKAIVAA